MIKSKKLEKYSNLSHGFFNKDLGLYKRINKSLNRDNLNIIRKKLGIKLSKIIIPNQTHSSKFFEIKKKSISKIDCDGLITKKSGIALGILTADCAPIMIYDKKLKFISIVHAGWKGALKGIITKTLNYYFRKGSNKKDIIVVIGPCIAQKNYEVKKDFFDKFTKNCAKNNKFFKKEKNFIKFSLQDYVRSKVADFGISNIEVIKLDTFERKNNFFSARYSLKKKFNDYGRNISVIMIK